MNYPSLNEVGMGFYNHPSRVGFVSRENSDVPQATAEDTSALGLPNSLSVKIRVGRSFDGALQNYMKPL
ncbi:hypothetical protein Cylst_2083 [Cylindrospermum stagnale PCC 7417]|uniref:Uncharacterized protein n=1 Tax=Cylindrospermum stagnale PCC 7417 TaxID=56107 RepID=K9WXT0_9NOST|nr:hypothetical protein Cylst_2083 [Cylindrospermum stagnale PCC 7417]